MISPPAQLPYITTSVSSAVSGGGRLSVVTSNVKCCKSGFLFFFFLLEKQRCTWAKAEAFNLTLRICKPKYHLLLIKITSPSPSGSYEPIPAYIAEASTPIPVLQKINRSWTHQKSIFFLLSHEVTAILQSESHKKRFMFVSQRDHSNNQPVTLTI